MYMIGLGVANQRVTGICSLFFFFFSFSEIIIRVSSGLPDKVFYDELYMYTQVTKKMKKNEEKNINGTSL